MMQITLSEFNTLGEEKAIESLIRCCGSSTWARKMAVQRPYENEAQLFMTARDIWYDHTQESDHQEAYAHHPKIGDKESLRERFESTKEWAADEQSGANQADENTLDLLTNNNNLYFDKNGYVFLVCATGKSAKEMSDLLSERLKHSQSEELGIAHGEQHKITLLRLQKLIRLEEVIWNQVSQITTHVLDTSIGSPGQHIPIRLKKKVEDGFQTMAMGITNADGRIANLLPAGFRLSPGHYQMCFDTATYFEMNNTTGFYPKVDIDFTVFDESHYHVPLLINPFGYSTYRGS